MNKDCLARDVERASSNNVQRDGQHRRLKPGQMLDISGEDNLPYSFDA